EALNSIFESRYILVRMLSEAGTGYAFNIKRARLDEKRVMLRYDPFGKKLTTVREELLSVGSQLKCSS
uniref:39S ribosomal protein L33, mitochondrial n=1 Tax=Anolis carolinensis TaxID=28377 RepID=A0A803T710_ANOCA